MVSELLIFALNNLAVVYDCAWLTDYHLILLEEGMFRGFSLSDRICDRCAWEQASDKHGELINLYFHAFSTLISPLSSAFLPHFIEKLDKFDCLCSPLLIIASPWLFYSLQVSRAYFEETEAQCFGDKQGVTI